jgi:hypothetical protein
VFSLFKPKFSIEHSGRGGKISFKLNGEYSAFNIEMGEGGNFLVFTGSEPKYNKVRKELRNYLDKNDKQGWHIVQ